MVSSIKNLRLFKQQDEVQLCDTPSQNHRQEAAEVTGLFFRKLLTNANFQDQIAGKLDVHHKCIHWKILNTRPGQFAIEGRETGSDAASSKRHVIQLNRTSIPSECASLFTKINQIYSRCQKEHSQLGKHQPLQERLQSLSPPLSRANQDADTDNDDLPDLIPTTTTASATSIATRPTNVATDNRGKEELGQDSKETPKTRLHNREIQLQAMLERTSRLMALNTAQSSQNSPTRQSITQTSSSAELTHLTRAQRVSRQRRRPTTRPMFSPPSSFPTLQPSTPVQDSPSLTLTPLQAAHTAQEAAQQRLPMITTPPLSLQNNPLNHTSNPLLASEAAATDSPPFIALSQRLQQTVLPPLNLPPPAASPSPSPMKDPVVLPKTTSQALKPTPTSPPEVSPIPSAAPSPLRATRRPEVPQSPITPVKAKLLTVDTLNNQQRATLHPLTCLSTISSIEVDNKTGDATFILKTPLKLYSAIVDCPLFVSLEEVVVPNPQNRAEDQNEKHPLEKTVRSLVTQQIKNPSSEQKGWVTEKLKSHKEKDLINDITASIMKSFIEGEGIHLRNSLVQDHSVKLQTAHSFYFRLKFLRHTQRINPDKPANLDNSLINITKWLHQFLLQSNAQEFDSQLLTKLVKKPDLYKELLKNKQKLARAQVQLSQQLEKARKSAPTLKAGLLVNKLEQQLEQIAADQAAIEQLHQRFNKILAEVHPKKASS